MTREQFLHWASRFSDALLFVAGDGRILACNAALTELVGRGESAVVGDSLANWAASAPDQVRAVLQLWSSSGRMIVGPAPFSIEGVGPLRCEGAAIQPAVDREPARLVVRVKRKAAAAERFVELNRKLEELHTELRAREQASAAIAKQREWLHVTLSSIGDAVIATDVHGNVEFLNNAAEQLTGWSLGEAAGRPVAEVFDIFDAETRRPMGNPVERALKERRNVTLEGNTILRARDGRERPIDDSAAPIRNANGTVIGAVVVFHDVTKQHEARRALQRARDEALAASRAKDDFLAALSHELRTPLNPALLLASQAAANPELPHQVRSDFAVIEKHILLEARLIDDLLDLTKVTHGKLALALEPVDITAVISDAIETVRAEIESRPLTVTVDWRAGNHRVLGDRARLQQVVWNIINNAVKFTPPGGRLMITTRRESATSVALEFTDTGAGITEAELARLFVPFSQGDHGKGGAHRFGGVGLGLAISRAIVEMHHGRITARSMGRDMGTTITITLPTIPRETTAHAGAPPAGAVAGHDGGGRQLLLVEDHEPTRTTTARLLAARNYEVRTAASVAEALEIANARKFDLVLSDIGLPDGDGQALMRELYERHHLRGIALSGYGTEHDKARSGGSGFVAHLTKPVTMKAIEAALAAFWSEIEQGR